MSLSQPSGAGGEDEAIRIPTTAPSPITPATLQPSPLHSVDNSSRYDANAPDVDDVDPIDDAPG